MQNDALTKNIYEFSVENTHTSASVHKALKLFCLQAMCLETSQIRSKHEASARRRGELQAQFKC